MSLRRAVGRTALMRTAGILGATLLTIGGVAACGSSTSQADGQGGPLTLNVGVQSLVIQTYYPQLAEALGYFKDENLKVNITVGESTANSIQGLIGDSIDVYIGGPEGLSANEQGADLRFVAAASNRSIWNIVTRGDVADLKQLENANIGVSAIQSLSTVTLKQALEAHGVDVGSVKYIVAGGTSKRYAAMDADQIEAAPLGIPVNYQATQDGGLKDFGNTNDLGAPPIAAAVLTVNKPWAEGHREVLKRFLRAYQRTIDALYRPDMKQQISQIISAGIKVDKQYVDRAIDEIFLKSDGSIVPKDAHIDPTALQTAADALRSYGGLKRDMDASQYLDNSYLEDAQSSLDSQPAN